MHTAQQQIISKKLIELAGKYKGVLTLTFLGALEQNNNRPVKTEAYRKHSRVVLILVEAYSISEFDEWEKAIEDARELCELITKERLYAYENPNFYQAISALMYDTVPEVINGMGRM
jgi:hypothetical protein